MSFLGYPCIVFTYTVSAMYDIKSVLLYSTYFIEGRFQHLEFGAGTEEAIRDTL